MDNLYKKLIRLVDKNKAFFYSDTVKDGETYRVFNYRIASYTDFLEPGALECRGHMFNITNKDDIRLVCVPLGKFFNLNENPFTMDIDLSTVEGVELKMDGSMISTFIHRGELYFKTKNSLTSTMVKDTIKYFSLPENKNFRSIISEITKNGYTVNLEYVSPTNRIIIKYKKTDLILLHIREISTGKYIPIKHFRSYKYYDELSKHKVKKFDLPADKILKIYDKTDIEGIVIKLDSGQFIKLKTISYTSLHKTKSSLSDKHIVECVLNKTSDDLKALFNDDDQTIGKISDIEEVIIPIYNETITKNEQFCNDNKNLDQKTFAIKAKEELKDKFNLGMRLFHNQTPDYNKYIMNRYEKFLKGD